MQTIAQIRHRSTLITLESIRTSHLKRRVSSAKALRELAWTFRPFEETLRDEIAWYRAQLAGHTCPPDRMPQGSPLQAQHTAWPYTMEMANRVW
ncbi:MAG TPA: hypothetical protein VFN02_00985 [Ktedonobacteraceae bacterium]|nr:hypothetical protein [Ktedonobacteraceae bacterium]